MHHMYVEITPAFAALYQGYRQGENVFNSAVTLDGRVVCSANSLNEFPEIFAELQQTGWTAAPCELTPEEFPLPEIPEL